MKKGEKKGNGTKHRQSSITAKTLNAVIISCIVLGLTAQMIGLYFYSAALKEQFIRNAFESATTAAMSAKHGMDTFNFAGEVMDIYQGLTEEQRQMTGTEEYRELFAHIDTGTGGTYDYLLHMLATYIKSGDIDDIYLAMIDKENKAMVYMVDPSEDGHIYIGEWESVTDEFVNVCLNWNGKGMMYDIEKNPKYGWVCTSGYPIRDDNNGKIVAFVFVDVTINNVIDELINYLIKITLALLIVTAAITFFLSQYMKKNITVPINTVAEAAKAYAADKQSGTSKTDHFTDLNLNTNDEIGNLGTIMAKMEQDILSYEENITRIAAENERISAELDLAAHIQLSALPSEFPAFPDRKEFDLFASMTPAREVGGDFYDFFLLGEDKLALVIADVSGKGVPAALFMMSSKMLINNFALYGESPAAIISTVNERICLNNENCMFVTVWLGILEISTGKLTFCNAGHTSPAIIKSDGRTELIGYEHNTAVGVMNGMPYNDKVIQLASGDMIFVYTDGVTEATDAEEKMYSEERMVDILASVKDVSPEKLINAVKSDVETFVGDAPQFDDITMLSVRYYGKR